MYTGPYYKEFHVPATSIGRSARLFLVIQKGNLKKSFTFLQSTVDDLIALGLNLDQTVAALAKVDDVLSAANYGIYRQRHANTTTAPRAAVPRGPPATP